MKHIMIPFLPDDIFYRAFENAVNVAKQNNALLSLVKVISYPAGIGMDSSLLIDATMREYDLYKFEKILPKLQNNAETAKVKLDVHVIDMKLSPAKAFVDFASKNDVDLIIMGSVKETGLRKYLDSDISEEIMNFNPPCSVILVE